MLPSASLEKYFCPQGCKVRLTRERKITAVKVSKVWQTVIFTTLLPSQMWVKQAM